MRSHSIPYSFSTQIVKRDALSRSTAGGLMWLVNCHSFGSSVVIRGCGLRGAAASLIGMRKIRAQEVSESISFP